jgi:PHD/YefM family antitoxin component YafN of YafNO toxin-antitoxin module
MIMTTLSIRKFNRHISKAKRAAKNGPVFIIHRGRPSHALLYIADYHPLTGENQKIADLLAMPSIEDAVLEIPKLQDLARHADLS